MTKLEVSKTPAVKAATLRELMAAFRDRTAHREYRIALARTAVAMCRS